MKTTRQIVREAKKLYRLCLLDGSLDEDRVRWVVQRVIEAERPGGLAVLTHFQRLVRLDRTAHSAHVESVAPLPADVREQIEAGLVGMYGAGIVTSFAENPALLGGVRVTVGSDVYDGSVAGGLAALRARF
jgi:F-type H+-transporting ATPase subunit delta